MRGAGLRRVRDIHCHAARMRFSYERERVLEASWTPATGLSIASADLPEEWSTALQTLVQDLPVRQFGGVVQRVDFWVEYDADSGFAWLGSVVSTLDGVWDGGGISGSGAKLDANVATILESMADLLQTEVADSSVAWPWGENGGFMDAIVVDGIARWVDRRTGASAPVGSLGEFSGDDPSGR